MKRWRKIYIGTEPPLVSFMLENDLDYDLWISFFWPLRRMCIAKACVLEFDYMPTDGQFYILIHEVFSMRRHTAKRGKLYRREAFYFSSGPLNLSFRHVVPSNRATITGNTYENGSTEMTIYEELKP